VRRRRGSVCSIALLLVCLELKSDSFSYRTQLHSIRKLQHYRYEDVSLVKGWEGKACVFFLDRTHARASLVQYVDLWQPRQAG
jgi:hypothetical protein